MSVISILCCQVVGVLVVSCPVPGFLSLCFLWITVPGSLFVPEEAHCELLLIASLRYPVLLRDFSPDFGLCTSPLYISLKLFSLASESDSFFPVQP